LQNAYARTPPKLWGHNVFDACSWCLASGSDELAHQSGGVDDAPMRSCRIEKMMKSKMGSTTIAYSNAPAVSPSPSASNAVATAVVMNEPIK
jgi:hypothetical protein